MMNKLLSKKRTINIERDFTPFVSDYETVITSPAFRRLQDKTQVFPLERNDFIHTRLTHSLEVMMIAKKLINNITYIVKTKFEKDGSHKEMYNEFNKRQVDILQILETACLIHDIGNPPFGHVGEYIIRNWFKENIEKQIVSNNLNLNKFGQDCLNDFYHFEGNAQALRIISKLSDNESGNMNLTYAVINTIMKYTADSLHIDNNITTKKKLGFFTSEKELVEAVYKETKVNSEHRHMLTYLLEASDDIAYLTADIEDAVKKKVVSFSHFKNWLEERIDDNSKSELNTLNNHSKYFSKLRNLMINGVRFVFTNQYVSLKNYTYNEKDLLSHKSNKFKDVYKFLKEYCATYIFTNEQILRTEVAGRTIINFLLKEFVPVAFCAKLNQQGNLVIEDKDKQMEAKLLSIISQTHQKACARTLSQIAKENKEEQLYHKLLMVTDFISGMTDSYAHSLYLELSGNKLP